MGGGEGEEGEARAAGQHWAPVTGKRQRQGVELWVPPSSPARPKAPKVAGAGTPLRDLANVASLLERVKGKDAICVTMHRLMYGSVGAERQRKAGVLAFCGLELSAESASREVEVGRVRARIDKVKGAELKELCKLLDLGWGGTKADVGDRLLAFLMEPQASGRRQPMASALKAAGKRPKATKAKAKGVQKTKKRAGTARAKAKADAEEEEDEEEEEEEGAEALRAAVLAYLGQPQTDLETVTNKMVRKEMEALFPGVKVDKAVVAAAVNEFLTKHG